ncbi:MAG: amino acid permease [Kutzneria sp.]|nr:amino acid permease [Kutzneria sp.]
MTTRDAQAADPTPAPQLRRALTGRQLSMIGLGGAIGTGLFLGSGVAISLAGPSTILAYVACALVAFVIAWALAEMAVVHPTAGSFGAIARRYLGPAVGFVVRWGYGTVQIIGTGSEVVAVGIYIQFWWPQIPLWMPVVAFSALIFGANAVIVRLFGTIEYWLAMIKVVAIVVFVLLGVILITVGLPQAPATGFGNLTGHGGFFTGGLSGLFMATVFALFSYMGTEAVAVTSAESEDPVQDIPRAARRMVVRLVLFYVLAITVVLTAVPWTDVAQGNGLTSSPFVRVFASAGIPAAATILNFVVLTAALSSANTNLYIVTRMLHSLAVDRQAPRWLGSLSRSGVPRNALVVAATGLVLASVLSFQQKSTAYFAMFGITIFGAIVVWMLILLTHWAFRRQRAAAGEPAAAVRLWGAPVTTVLAGLFLLAALVSTAFITQLSFAWIAGLAFFAVLGVAYLIVSRRGSAVRE